MEDSIYHFATSTSSVLNTWWSYFNKSWAFPVTDRLLSSNLDSRYTSYRRSHRWLLINGCLLNYLLIMSFSKIFISPVMDSLWTSNSINRNEIIMQSSLGAVTSDSAMWAEGVFIVKWAKIYSSFYVKVTVIKSGQ